MFAVSKTAARVAGVIAATLLCAGCGSLGEMLPFVGDSSGRPAKAVNAPAPPATPTRSPAERWRERSKGSAATLRTYFSDRGAELGWDEDQIGSVDNHEEALRAYAEREIPGASRDPVAVDLVGWASLVSAYITLSVDALPPATRSATINRELTEMTKRTALERIWVTGPRGVVVYASHLGGLPGELDSGYGNAAPPLTRLLAPQVALALALDPDEYGADAGYRYAAAGGLDRPRVILVAARRP